MFQATRFLKDDVRRLVRTINANAEDNEGIPQPTLDLIFDKWWPDLERDVSKIMEDYPSPDQLDLFASKLSPFTGTEFDVAGGGKTDRALEYFLWVILPALSKADWVHIDWGVLEDDTFQIPFSSSKPRYGVVTGVTGIVVQADMHGNKNAAADALVEALNEIGIPATKEYAQAKNSNHNAVHILVGQSSRQFARTALIRASIERSGSITLPSRATRTKLPMSCSHVSSTGNPAAVMPSKRCRSGGAS